MIPVGVALDHRSELLDTGMKTVAAASMTK